MIMQTTQYRVLLVLVLFFSVSAAKAEKGPLWDSLANLYFDSNTYTSTLNALTKLNKPLAEKIDSSVKYIYRLPITWIMTRIYQDRLVYVQYKNINAYALLVEQDYMLYEKINKQYPEDWRKNAEPIREISLKPVIYLYPEKEQNIDVTLDFKGKGLYTWPHVDDKLGWSVTAQPNGMLKDRAGEEYPYLFWEGAQEDMSYVDYTEGFVVAGNELGNFLIEKLKVLGLNARERTDFITFWVPRVKNNATLFVRFETSAYNKSVPLTIVPAPESIQRIFVVFKNVPDTYVCKPQQIVPFARKGYTVIEWGGCEMHKTVN